MRGGLSALTVLAFLAVAAPCGAQGRAHDFDQAREAVTRGEAMALVDLLAKIGPALAGEIVAVELEREGGRWVYEFKVVGPDGRRQEVLVDARNGEILKGRRN